MRHASPDGISAVDTANTTAVGAQLCAMLSLQYGATFAKALYPAVGASGTTALRLVTATVMLGAATRPWRARLALVSPCSLLLYGATLGAMNWTLYLALKSIPLGIASAIQFSGPLFLATWTSRRTLDFLWIGLAIIGLLLLLVPHGGPGHRLDALGVLFAFCSAVSWAAYILSGQRVGAALGPGGAFFGVMIAALVVAPFGIALSDGAVFGTNLLPSAVLVGFLTCALPFLLELEALTRLPAKVYGTLTSLEPAIGALMGLAFLHERLSRYQWTGIGTILGAAIGAVHAMRPRVSRTQLP